MNELKVIENKEEIVIYNNDLNTKVYLKKFNNFNWDIFMIVVSALAYTKNGVAEISLVEIKKKTNYTSQNNENFKNKLKETNRKILQSVCEIETGEDTEQFPLFKKFKIIGKKSLRVEVGEDYMSFFTDYSEYTSFGLKTFLTLKNKYTKPLFKELMQFKATGKAFFRMEDFRNKLDIPKSLSFSKIRDRILIPSIKDFSILFKNYKIIAKFLDGEEIEINENMSVEAKKDRRQVTNINFFFVLTKKEDVITEKTEVVSNQAERLQTTNITDEEEIDIKEEERLFNLDMVKSGLEVQNDIAEEEIALEKKKVERYKEYIKQTREAGAIDSADEAINRDIINHYEFCIKEALEKIRSLEAEIVKNKEEIEKIENEIGCNQVVSNQASNNYNNNKKDIEIKEEIDYLKLIKEFLSAEAIDYRYVEKNIEFLLEKYSAEEIYKEILRIDSIKDEKASINPKKYLIVSINNIDEIKEKKKIDRKQSERLQAINENIVENKEEVLNNLFGFIDEED